MFKNMFEKVIKYVCQFHYNTEKCRTEEIRGGAFSIHPFQLSHVSMDSASSGWPITTTTTTTNNNNNILIEFPIFSIFWHKICTKPILELKILLHSNFFWNRIWGWVKIRRWKYFSSHLEYYFEFYFSFDAQNDLLQSFFCSIQIFLIKYFINKVTLNLKSNDVNYLEWKVNSFFFSIKWRCE